MTDTTWALAHGRVRRRGRPPASDSAVTRERILQAARKVFAESGYESATFQAIAMEIGLTRPAINNYFASKSVLYGEVVHRAGKTIRDAITHASDAPTLAGQLTAFLRLTIHGDDADPALAAFLVQSAMEAQHLPQFGDESPVATQIERFVRDAVDSAVRRGEVDTTVAEALCDALMGVVWGSAFQVSRGIAADGPRADRMLGEFQGLLQRAVG
jgi:AcrR family transcriptional regulator